MMGVSILQSLDSVFIGKTPRRVKKGKQCNDCICVLKDFSYPCSSAVGIFLVWVIQQKFP